MAKKTLSRAEARRQAGLLGLAGFVLAFTAAALFTLPSFQSRSEARDQVETARKEAEAEIAKRDRYAATGTELSRLIEQVRAADRLMPQLPPGGSVELDVKLAIDAAVLAAGAQIAELADPTPVTAPGLPQELRAFRAVFSFTGTLDDLSQVITSLENSGQLMAVSGVSVGDAGARAPLSAGAAGTIRVTGVFVFSTKPAATVTPMTTPPSTTTPTTPGPQPDQNPASPTQPSPASSTAPPAP